MSLSCAGTPAILRSDVNETNKNIAPTLVCNEGEGEAPKRVMK